VVQIINFEQNNKSNILCCLILKEKIEQSSFGLTTENMADALDVVLTQYKEIKGTETVISKSSHLRLYKLAKLLRNINLDLDRENIQISLKIGNLLNENGFSMETLVKLFYDLNACQESACKDCGNEVISASRVLELAIPMLNKSNPSISEMLPLIQELRNSPVINIDIVDFTKYDKFSTRWDKWLERHPAISAYMDPPCVVVEPVPHVVGAVPPIIATLPALTAQPVNLPDFPGGAPWAGIYRMATIQEARMVAVALRTHLAAPPGGIGGGAGPAHRICVFSTTGGGFERF